MRRVLNEAPPTLAVLAVGMVLGWWLSGSGVMWWLIVALFVAAIVCRIAQLVMDARQKPATTP